jgi:hypothetical protein
MPAKKYLKTQSSAAPGPIFGLGFIGALIYYLQQAGSFWSVVLGILKACVWPALLVYHLLGL